MFGVWCTLTSLSSIGMNGVINCPEEGFRCALKTRLIHAYSPWNCFLQHLDFDLWCLYKVAKSFSHVWISCLVPGVTFPFGHQCKRAYYGHVEGVCQTQNQTTSWVFTTWFFGCRSFIMVTRELARLPNPFYMYGLVVWRLGSLFHLGISSIYTSNCVPGWVRCTQN